MFCNNCGNQLDDKAKFCMNCGKPVEAPKPAVPGFAPAPDLADDTFRPRTPARPAAPPPVYASPVKPAAPTPVYSTPKKPAALSAEETPATPVAAKPAQPSAPAYKPASPTADPPKREAPTLAGTAPVMAPIPAKTKRSGMNWKLLVILLLIAGVIGVVVWGFVDGWLPDLFSGDQTQKDRDEDEEEDKDTDPYADWNDYEINGLTIYLPDAFEEADVYDDGAVFGSDDDDFDGNEVEIEISSGPVEDFPTEVNNADDFAEFYVESIQDRGGVIQDSGTENGVPYVISAEEEDADEVMVVAFYVDGETGWVVVIEEVNFGLAEDMIQYVTSGEVKKSSENRDEDEDRDDDRDDDRVSAENETRPPEPAYEVESDGYFGECNGMRFRLDDSFEEVLNDDTTAYYQNGVMNVEVSSGDMEDIGEDIDSSREFADFYAESIEYDSYEQVIYDKQNGISYIITLTVEDDWCEAYGFYVEGDTGWIIRITTSNYYDYQDQIIDIITSGELD